MNKDRFKIGDSIRLLNGVLYKEVIETNQYKILVSYFKNKSYNYIMPKVQYSASIVDKINEIIGPFLKNGYGFSYYIEEKLCLKWKIFIEKGLKLEYSDLYVYRNEYSYEPIDDKKVVIMKKDNFSDFVKSIEECYSDWEDNYEFTKWMLDTKEVITLGVKQDGKIVAFGSFIQKSDSNMVILMNDGTIPAFRRQGLHEFLIKYRCNEILAKNKNAVVYANLEKGGGSHLGFSKLGFRDGPLFFVYSVI